MKETERPVLDKNYLFLIFLLLLPLANYSQVGNLFSTDAELSSSLINQVFQDNKGYIWIATEDGLDRFDGAKFSTYKHNKSDSTSILNNYVKTVFQTEAGEMFFGFFNGLQYFDHATEEFHEIPLFIENNVPYPAHVTSIIERKSGDILVSTSGQGIFILKNEKGRAVGRKLKEIAPSYFLEGMFEDSNGNLWVLSQDKGLFNVTQTGEIKNYLIDNEQEIHISSICEDKNTNLYLGSLSKGLYSYNKKSDDFQLIEASRNLPVKSLYVNNKNKILLGTDGKGLKIYDPVKGKIHVEEFNIANFNFTKTKVHSITQDKHNNLWLGIYQKGVLLIPDKVNNFGYIGYQSFKKNIIGSNSIVSVFKDKQDVLWVGTDGDGLYGIVEEKEQKFHLAANSGKDYSSIMTIYQDSKNDLWVGTYLEGLAKLDRKNKELKFLDNLKDHEGNTVERIYSIIEDKQENLWIGSLGFGLYSYNISTETATNHNEIVGGSQYDHLHNTWINTLLLSKNNDKLFLGTYDGLSILNLQKNTYLDKEGKNHILNNKIVYSLYEDEGMNLWIGTSEGLFYKPQNDSITQIYTTDDGLPSNVICAIEKDSNNNLWISTNNGISKFELKSKNFKNFYFRDGLQGNEFNKNASFSEENGRLFFGSTNGVTFFDPKKIISKGTHPDLKITGFYLQDKPVKKGMKSGSYSIVDKAIVDADTIELAYQDNDFTIEFSSFDFRNLEYITFSYALNSENWINIRPGANTVTFNNLEPGIYNFKVRAKDNEEFSNIQELAIIIHSPWYLSTWAKLAYFFAFVIIAYLIVQEVLQRRKTKKELQEHLRAEQINQAKLQFLTNISHDIKTPISLIINPLKKLIETDEGEDRQRLYRIMLRNSERILHLLNQLINARKFDQGKIELKFQNTEIISFVKSIASLFEDQIESREIQLTINHPDSDLMAYIDPGHFDKIIQNLLSNALKFTPQKGAIEISIGLKENQKQFYISVKDNGIGIKDSEIMNVFDRFYQVHNDQGRQTEGTGIGLHLTRSIAALHHGTVEARNNKNDRGCEFIICAPLGKKHLNEKEIISKVPSTNPGTAEVPTVNSIIKEEEQLACNPEKNKPTILIVDDDNDLRDYIAAELGNQYNFFKISNGKLAFPEVIKNLPDLIISDVVMPVMDGITLTKKIKKNINTNHIPIILLTGKTDKETNLEGLEIGVDAYINKPFNTEILQKTVKNLLRNRTLLRNTYSGNQLQENKIEQIKLKSGDETLLEKFMDVVNKNINNPDLNIEMVASELGISRVHLYRKLKELTNQSAGELIMNVKLKQAANLLISKKVNISEVAYAVGFSSTSKFSTKFKDLYGASPSNYRKKYLPAK